MNTLRLIFTLLFLSLLTACSSTAEAPLPTLVDVATVAPPTSASVAVLRSPTATLSTPTITTTTTATTGTPATGAPRIRLSPSKTITNTITPPPPPTATGTYELSGLDFLIQTALVSTVLPQSYIATPGGGGILLPTADSLACTSLPPGGFGVLYNADPFIRQELGCPLGAPALANARQGAAQTFQYGFMVWAFGTPNMIYAFYSNGSYARYPDTFDAAADPDSGGETPPTGLLEPVRGFGKVWRSEPTVRSELGWATALETAGTATTVEFERGVLMHISTRADILVLASDPAGTRGRWRSAPGTP